RFHRPCACSSGSEEHASTANPAPLSTSPSIGEANVVEAMAPPASDVDPASISANPINWVYLLARPSAACFASAAAVDRCKEVCRACANARREEFAELREARRRQNHIKLPQQGHGASLVSDESIRNLPPQTSQRPRSPSGVLEEGSIKKSRRD